MRAFKKGQMNPWLYGQELLGEIRPVERQFNVYAT